MIITKYMCDDGETILEFSNVELLISSTYFDKLIYIDMSNTNLTEAPTIWPIGLQILKCEENRLRKIENLPSTLRTLYARTNKLEEFPIVSHCADLELIDLYDNNIVVYMQTVIPNSVKAIVISFNKLKYISYHSIPAHVRITASFCF